jgi:hypothetical protein
MAGLVRVRLLEAQIAGTTTVTAAVSGERQISVTIQGATAVVATLVRTRLLAASVLGTTTVTATLAPAQQPGMLFDYKVDVRRIRQRKPGRVVLLHADTIRCTTTVTARLAIASGVVAGVPPSHHLLSPQHDEEEEIAAMYALGVI